MSVEGITQRLARAHLAPKTAIEENPQEHKVALTTNMFSLFMNKKISVYQYHVDVVVQTGSRLGSLVKKTKDDFIAIDHKDKCRAAFRLAVRGHRSFFQQPNGMFYDLQATLYSINKLVSDDDAANKIRKEFLIDGMTARKAAALSKGAPFDALYVHVTAVDESYELKLDDSFIEKAKGVDVDSNRELIRFLEVATSQHAYLEQKTFVTFPSGLSFFKVDEKQLDSQTHLEGGHMLMEGTKKAVKLIDGQHKLGEAGELAVVVDPKKGAFHVPGMTVAQKVKELGFFGENNTVHPRRIEQLSDILKHLFVETQYGSFHRRFDIHSIVNETARKNRFTLETGGSISVMEYYKTKYNICLEMPDAPLVCAKMKGKPGIAKITLSYFPMEVLHVCANQRVTANQQTPQMISSMIRACAMLPKDRQQLMYKHAEALGVNGRTPMSCLAAAQLNVANELIRVEGRVLAPPQIVYKDQRKYLVDRNTGKWKTSGAQKPEFLVGATLNNWAMLLISNKSDPAEQSLVRQFANELQRECCNRGMRVDNVKYLDVVAGSFEAVEEAFQKGKKEGLEFMFFIQDSRISVHKDIKFCERKYEIISQDLNMNTARNVVELKKFLSLENIVNKTNVKLGGLNYSMIVNAPGNQHLFAKGRLYIGFQVSHPAPFSSDEVARGVLPRTPTVIGIAGNVTKEPAAFVGDVFYQTPRSDQMVSAMKELIFSFANRYKAAVGVAPAEVVIYRNGASEGQYGNLLATEIPIIRSALKEAGACDAKLTLMVVSKLHSVRIMPAAISGVKAPDQNVKPGTVVDTTIVHPAFAEFYLNSHQALQGSAKTPKYTVIVDESIFPMSYLELMTYVLSYGHQIVGLPTSLPTPVYVAGRYAERGAMLLSSAKNEKHYADFEQMTSELAYGQSTMADKRINA